MGEDPRKPCPDNPWQVLQYCSLASRSRFEMAPVSSARPAAAKTVARIAICNANCKVIFIIRPPERERQLCCQLILRRRNDQRFDPRFAPITARRLVWQPAGTEGVCPVGGHAGHPAGRRAQSFGAITNASTIGNRAAVF